MAGVCPPHSADCAAEWLRRPCQALSPPPRPSGGAGRWPAGPSDSLYVTEMVCHPGLVGATSTLAMVRTDPAERVRSSSSQTDPATVSAFVRILVEGGSGRPSFELRLSGAQVTRKAAGRHPAPWKRTDLLAA